MIDSSTAYNRTKEANTYKFIKEKYLPQVDLKVFNAMDKGRLECDINAFSILGFKAFKYKENLFTVIFKEYFLKGYSITIKGFKISIDWINEVYKERNSNEEKKEDKTEESGEDSSTGAPREIEADNESEDEEAIFTPKPLKMHIGFRP